MPRTVPYPFPANTQEKLNPKHDGPQSRTVRMAAGATLSETAFKAGVDIGLLSKFERGIANLTPEQRKRLAAVLSAAIHARRAAIDAVMTAPSLAPKVPNECARKRRTVSCL